MRRYLSIWFLSCFAFVLNCKEPVKTIFTERTFSSENQTVVQINIPKASGNSLVDNTINSEIDNVVIHAFDADSRKNNSSISIEETIANFNTDYKNFISNFSENAQPWEAQIDGEVLYQSYEVISISITTYINKGGAHGSLNILFLNFDSTTGLSITNTNLFKDIDGFKKIAKIYLDKTLKAKALSVADEDFKLPENIGYTDDGLVLLYNTHEILPYADGIIEFSMPFEAVNPFLVFNGSN